MTLIPSNGDNAELIQGTPVSTTAPADGQVLVYSDADKQWEPQTPASAAGNPTFSAENKDSGTLAAGAPVATHSSGTGIIGASAASGTGLQAVGLLAASVAAGFSGGVITDGPLTLADWTAVVGTTTLAAKAAYYLDTTAGRLTATPPAQGGQALQRIGVAVGPNTLDVRIARPILL